MREEGNKEGWKNRARKRGRRKIISIERRRKERGKNEEKGEGEERKGQNKRFEGGGGREG